MNNYQSNHEESKTKRRFDLEDRTFKLSVRVVNFCKQLPQDNINRPIINQLVRSSTSIGANYSEANEANSKKDFINKIAIAKKEAKETRYWLRLIAATLNQFSKNAEELFSETQELVLIFASIIRNSKM